ncbi:MAG TPA: ParA family protein [Albitalea sp.]|uniref:ParA family protein n=1 Tax=Piscinibacter sp. TaxID=1903157 RepID=UPI002ED5CAE2
MPVIVVANPKGGVGKSTLSTQIAGYLASRGHAVMLGDVDRQQSSRMWLKLRPEGLPVIQAWEVGDGDTVRPPKGTTHVVLDTPAGLHNKRLDEVMKHADKVLIPLQPSIFDIHATHAFLREILAKKRHGKVDVAVVGMRIKEGTISADQLRHFLGTLAVPVIGHIRDTQNYVHLAARGLTLWDVAPSRVQRDLEQWEPIAKWLDS